MESGLADSSPACEAFVGICAAKGDEGADMDDGGRGGREAMEKDRGRSDRADGVLWCVGVDHPEGGPEEGRGGDCS